MRNILQVKSKTADISSDEGFYNYINSVFVHAVHPDLYYNGKPKVWDRFANINIEDFVNVLMGVPRVRQVRVRPEKCHVPNSVQAIYPECFDHYSSDHQETKTFFQLWVPVQDMKLRRPTTNDVWKYRDENDETFVKSRTIYGSTGSYDGGGYVAELGRATPQTTGVMRYLKRSKWIDKQTRAIFVEFTVFNANMNMFLDVVMLVERGPSHSFATSFHITPVYLSTDDDVDAFYYYSIRISYVCILIVLIILIIIFISNIFAPSELHAHKQIWFWFDLVVIACIITSISVALKRHFVMLENVEIVQRMKINEYISLQQVAYWEGVQNAMFSITQMICFLKIWKLLVYLDGSFLTTSLTVGLASRILLSYFFVIIIVLVAFSCSGHILFGSSMLEFSTFSRSFITLVGQSLEVNLFSKLYTVDKVVGPIYASIFGFLVTFIFLNILIAILNQSMIYARMVAKEKYRTWGIAETVFHRIFNQPPNSAPDVVTLTNTEELQPHRLEGLKKSTINFFKSALQSKDAQQMNKMKAFTKHLLEGTGQQIALRKPSKYHQEMAKEARINEMRLSTAEFLKMKIGAEMNVEELQKYNAVNKTVVSLRIFKLEKKVRQLQHLLNKV